MIAAYFGLDWCVRAIVYHFLDICEKRHTVKARLEEDAGHPKHVPGTFEFLSRAVLKEGVLEDSAAAAVWAVPLSRVPGKRTCGFMNAQMVIDRPLKAGDMVEVTPIH
jgi:hypothetical protein